MNWNRAKALSFLAHEEHGIKIMYKNISTVPIYIELDKFKIISTTLQNPEDWLSMKDQARFNDNNFRKMAMTDKKSFSEYAKFLPFHKQKQRGEIRRNTL